MRIAVVGGGLAGLSVLWHLLQYPQVEAHLFDYQEIGKGASGVSTGLLHPFPGKKALDSQQSHEAMSQAMQLLHEAEGALGRKVYHPSGLLRIALTEEQKGNFQRRAREDARAVWWSQEQCQEVLGPARCYGGIWIPEAVSVYSRLYLEGLWRALQKNGVCLHPQKIENPKEELKDFASIVFACGYETPLVIQDPSLAAHITKGHALLCRSPSPLRIALASQGHITPTEDPFLCRVGSTYERNFLSLEVEKPSADQLLKKVACFYPQALDFEILQREAGARLGRRENYLPLCQRIGSNRWVFTALGSRGLLYHGLFGKQLAQEVTSLYC